MTLRKALVKLESPSKIQEWLMLGTGWLWLARALNVAGAVGLALSVWKFLSPSLAWLLYFFISLAVFLIAAVIKKRSVLSPTVPSETAAVGDDVAKALGMAFPPAPMFDRDGRTPLERAFAEGQKEGKAAGRSRAR